MSPATPRVTEIRRPVIGEYTASPLGSVQSAPNCASARSGANKEAGDGAPVEVSSGSARGCEMLSSLRVSVREASWASGDDAFETHCDGTMSLGGNRGADGWSRPSGDPEFAASYSAMLVDAGFQGSGALDSKGACAGDILLIRLVLDTSGHNLPQTEQLLDEEWVRHGHRRKGVCFFCVHLTGHTVASTASRKSSRKVNKM